MVGLELLAEVREVEVGFKCRGQVTWKKKKGGSKGGSTKDWRLEHGEGGVGEGGYRQMSWPTLRHRKMSSRGEGSKVGQSEPSRSRAAA